jgi:hypothetical protein
MCGTNNNFVFHHSEGLTCFRGARMGVNIGMCLARIGRFVSESEVVGAVWKAVRRVLQTAFGSWD